MNTSVVAINNEALGMVGCQRIRSMDDAGTEAAACRFFWPLTRSYVLASHPWKCVGKPATLTTTTAAILNYSYAYPMPADAVRMISMDDPDADFLELRRVLYCYASPASILYVPEETDPTTYDAGLVMGLTLLQAYRLSLGLRQDKDLARLIMTDLEKFFLPVIRMGDAARRGVRTLASSSLTAMFQ